MNPVAAREAATQNVATQNVATQNVAIRGVADRGAAGAQLAATDPSARRGTPILSLDGATVRAARGTVFGPIDAESRSAVTVVLGDRGSGRTSLLLCLGGRMRLGGGSLTVLGETKAGRIRRRTGVAGFEAIDALEPSVTLGDILRERLAWASPWYRRIPRITPERGRELLAPAFGDAADAGTGAGTGAGVAIPHPDTLVRELTPAQEMLVRISLALIEAPELLLIDDFDALRNPAERAHVADRLAALAGGAGSDTGAGLRVVLATSDPGDAELLAAAGVTPSMIRL